ncbi:hypothetical protein GGR55DRAFT_681823 [Xylaria sp. FL0064]|nr:hypothetical protein GGR55DRAFT_681823 [Xylaria sp. FL0064]
MMQSRDVDDQGKFTVNVAMVVFVILVIIMWALMGFQIYRRRKQDRAVPSDLETGAAVPIPEADVSLYDLLRTPKESQRYREDPPIRFFHKVRSAFPKQKSEMI